MKTPSPISEAGTAEKIILDPVILICPNRTNKGHESYLLDRSVADKLDHCPHCRSSLFKDKKYVRALDAKEKIYESIMKLPEDKLSELNNYYFSPRYLLERIILDDIKFVKRYVTNNREAQNAIKNSSKKNDTAANNTEDLFFLHCAVKHASLGMVKILLECGADSSMLDGYGQTLLMWAIGEGKVDIVNYLLSNVQLDEGDKLDELDINRMNHAGITALVMAIFVLPDNLFQKVTLMTNEIVAATSMKFIDNYLRNIKIKNQELLTLVQKRLRELKDIIQQRSLSLGGGNEPGTMQDINSLIENPNANLNRYLDHFTGYNCICPIVVASFCWLGAKAVDMYGKKAHGESRSLNVTCSEKDHLHLITLELLEAKAISRIHKQVASVAVQDTNEHRADMDEELTDMEEAAHNEMSPANIGR